ncbi:MAG: alpha/beta hydrolase [Armatimonadota bacterium]
MRATPAALLPTMLCLACLCTPGLADGAATSPIPDTSEVMNMAYLADQARAALTDAALAALRQAEGESKEYTYKTTPQGELRIYLDFPPGWSADDARPAIVFFFGGGWRSGTVNQFATQAKYLAERGMVAARADYRVKSRHDVNPDKCVEDAKSAMRWLRANAKMLGLDPDRIIAGGGSAGAHLAACTATTPGLDAETDDTTISCKPAALVLFNPVLNLAGSARLAERLGSADIAQAISPTLHLSEDTPPAIMFYGTDDRLIVHGEEFLEKAAEIAGLRVEMYTAEGVGHGFFNRPPWKQKTLYKADQFLASLGYLEGEPTLEVPDEGPELQAVGAPNE